jgi:murein DD-endopeptidase MepM/ murein hydrolase activator NlpD
MRLRKSRGWRAAIWAFCSVGGLSACSSTNFAPVVFYKAGNLTSADAGAAATGSGDPSLAPIATAHVERQGLETSSLAPPAGATGQGLVVAAPAMSEREALTPIVIVKPGDTLYSIARVTGVDRKGLAEANGLKPPYTLKVGARLTLPPESRAQLAAGARSSAGEGGPLLRMGQYPPPPASAPTPVDPLPEFAPAAPSARGFIWPVSGRIIADFGLQRAGHTNDGIDIAVPEGTPVMAARAGEVIYTGNELKGYGNLVLIQHDDGYVSAYAHNSKILVKRGDYVRQGQNVAESGQSGNAEKPLVHFEIRKDRKAVNPQAFLPRA